jgi:hypothetical protein
MQAGRAERKRYQRKRYQEEKVPGGKGTRRKRYQEEKVPGAFSPQVPFPLVLPPTGI